MVYILNTNQEMRKVLIKKIPPEVVFNKQKHD